MLLPLHTSELPPKKAQGGAPQLPSKLKRAPTQVHDERFRARRLQTSPHVQFSALQSGHEVDGIPDPPPRLCEQLLEERSLPEGEHIQNSQAMNE